MIPNITPAYTNDTSFSAIEKTLFNDEFYNNALLQSLIDTGVFSKKEVEALETLDVEALEDFLDALDAQYLADNLDVSDSVIEGSFSNGLQHFVNNGSQEGRRLFQAGEYLNANDDVISSVLNGGVSSALEHFITVGYRENRAFNSGDFSQSEYIMANEDVAIAIQNGDYFDGLEHYLLVGHNENRSIQDNSVFDEAFYLERYSDVAQAVEDGYFKSGAEHYIEFGKKEGRLSVSLIEEPKVYEDKSYEIGSRNSAEFIRILGIVIENVTTSAILYSLSKDYRDEQLQVRYFLKVEADKIYYGYTEKIDGVEYFVTQSPDGFQNHVRDGTRYMFVQD